MITSGSCRNMFFRASWKLGVSVARPRAGRRRPCPSANRYSIGSSIVTMWTGRFSMTDRMIAGERRGLARPGRPGDEDQARRQVDEGLEDLGQVELGDRRQLEGIRRKTAASEPRWTKMLRGSGRPRSGRSRCPRTGSARAAPSGPASGSRAASPRAPRAGGLGVERDQPSLDPQQGRPHGLQVEVGSLLLGHELEQVCECQGSRIIAVEAVAESGAEASARASRRVRTVPLRISTCEIARAASDLRTRRDPQPLEDVGARKPRVRAGGRQRRAGKEPAREAGRPGTGGVQSASASAARGPARGPRPTLPGRAGLARGGRERQQGRDVAGLGSPVAARGEPGGGRARRESEPSAQERETQPPAARRFRSRRMEGASKRAAERARLRAPEIVRRAAPAREDRARAAQRKAGAARGCLEHPDPARRGCARPRLPRASERLAGRLVTSRRSGARPWVARKRAARRTRSGSSARFCARDGAQPPGREIRQAAERVEDHRRVVKSTRQRVDGEVAARKSSSIEAALDLGDVDRRACPRRGRRAAERSREEARHGRGRRLQRAGEDLRVARHRGVDLGDGAAEQQIARGAADDPDSLSEPRRDCGERPDLRAPGDRGRPGRRAGPAIATPLSSGFETESLFLFGKRIKQPYNFRDVLQSSAVTPGGRAPRRRPRPAAGARRGASRLDRSSSPAFVSYIDQLRQIPEEPSAAARIRPPRRFATMLRRPGPGRGRSKRTPRLPHGYGVGAPRRRRRASRDDAGAIGVSRAAPGSVSLDRAGCVVAAPASRASKSAPGSALPGSASDGRRCPSAFLEVTAEQALEEARGVDARVAAGRVLPLAGVPHGDQGQHVGRGPDARPAPRGSSRDSARRATRRRSRACGGQAPSSSAGPTWTSSRWAPRPRTASSS